MKKTDYHTPKPYFRTSRNCWYVQLDGHETTLGADENAAFARYHELMAQRCKKNPDDASDPPTLRDAAPGPLPLPVPWTVSPNPSARTSMKSAWMAFVS